MNHDLIPSPKNENFLLKAIKEVPEELLWKANFNSDNSIKTGVSKNGKKSFPVFGSVDNIA